MTYGWIKNQVLMLINQYSIAGAEVAPSYNNQQDYINKIPNLVNDAMLEIATTVRKIQASFKLSDLIGEEHGEEIWYELPNDFFQFKSGDTVKTVDGKTLHTNQFSLYGKRMIIVPKNEVGDYVITYYRYPRPLPGAPEDKAVLDNDPETHVAIPYYVASMLVAHDNSFLCALFTNKYDDKLSKMLPQVSAEVRKVDDVYDFYR